MWFAGLEVVHALIGTSKPLVDTHIQWPSTDRSDVSIPWSLSDYHHLNICVVTWLSVLLNSLLAYLLLTETDTTFKPYKRLLFLNCAVDVIFTVVNVAVGMQVDVADGYMIFVPASIAKGLAMKWNYAAIWTWCASLLMAILIVPFEFYFRYLKVCREKLLSTVHLIGLTLAMFCLSAIASAFLTGSVINRTADLESVILDSRLTDDTSDPSQVLAAERADPMFQLFAISTVTLVVGSYLIVNVWSRQVSRTLQQNAGKMSKKTMFMQNQLSRLETAELLSILFVGVIPLVSLVTLPFVAVGLPGASIVLTGITAWIPIMNPLTTLLLVAPYRKALLRFVHLNRRTSTVHTLHAIVLPTMRDATLSAENA
ncbi:Protein STR-92 [Aphelenchoides avenae]|nr:Protein STR-92 [Aphelenchus avenae]